MEMDTEVSGTEAWDIRAKLRLREGYDMAPGGMHAKIDGRGIGNSRTKGRIVLNEVCRKKFVLVAGQRKSLLRRTTETEECEDGGGGGGGEIKAVRAADRCQDSAREYACK